MSRRGWIYFAAMSVIWGIPYLLIRVAVEGDSGVSAPFLVFARCVIGAGLLLPFVLRGGQLRGLGRYWLPISAFAVGEIMIPWVLLSHAEVKLTSSLTGLLIAFSPILAVLMGKLTGGSEVLSLRRWAGLGLGFVGVFVLAFPELTGGDTLAITEVLLVALCYGTAPIIASRYLQDVPTLPLTVVCLSGAALFYAIPAALTWPTEVPAAKVVGSVIGLGVICTALAFVVFLALIREAGPSRALLFTYVNPAVAVAAGVVFVDEPLTAGIIAAFVLILSGSVLATAGGGEAEPDVQAEATEEESPAGSR